MSLNNGQLAVSKELTLTHVHQGIAVERVKAEQEYLRLAADGSQAYFEREAGAERFAALHRGY